MYCRNPGTVAADLGSHRGSHGKVYRDRSSHMLVYYHLYISIANQVSQAPGLLQDRIQMYDILLPPLMLRSKTFQWISIGLFMNTWLGGAETRRTLKNYWFLRDKTCTVPYVFISPTCCRSSVKVRARKAGSKQEFKIQELLILYFYRLIVQHCKYTNTVVTS